MGRREGRGGREKNHLMPKVRIYAQISSPPPPLFSKGEVGGGREKNNNRNKIRSERGETLGREEEALNLNWHTQQFGRKRKRGKKRDGVPAMEEDWKMA